MKRKAFGYLRVSGKGQAGEDKHGLQRQREAIQRYAKSNKVEVVEWFTDAGVSGATELDNRPALGELVLAVETNGVSDVLVERLDRLARDLVVQELILARFKRSGVRLTSVSEGDVGDGDPSRKLVRQIMGSVAEYDKAILVAKLRAARENKRRRSGRCEGPRFYGESDPAERRAVERVYELRRKRPGRRRLGSTRIAQAMQREGFPTRFGGEWTAQTVKAILASPVYREIGKRERSET